MNDWVRLIATSVIWIAVAGVIVAVTMTSQEVVPIAVVMGIGATVSTGVIWDSARPKADEDQKAKRNTRLTRLVNDLDEDEVYSLEELLQSRRESQYEERQ